MSEDLYQEWLGIPLSGRKASELPDHYTLLGLPHFCHHRGAVELAAKQRLEKLDPYAMLPDRAQREAATRIMNEVATAKVALTEAKYFKRYDKQLAARLGVAVPTTEVPAPSNLLALIEKDYALAVDADAPAAPADQGGVAPLDPSLLDVDGPPIHAEVDFSAKPSAVTPPGATQTSEKTASGPGSGSMLPVGIAMGVLLLLIIGIVVAVVMMFKTQKPPSPPTPVAAQNPSLSPTSSSGSSPNTPDTATKKQSDVSVEPDVVESFDRPLLGTRYRVRASQGPGAKLIHRKMVLMIGGREYGQSRVSFTPMQTRRPIRKASMSLDLAPKATLTLALANGSLRLILKNTTAGLRIKASPGSPPADAVGWPVLKINPRNLKLVAERTPDAVVWRLGDQVVATSPLIDPRKTTTLIFDLAGIGGTTASISDLAIWYQP